MERQGPEVMADLCFPKAAETKLEKDENLIADYFISCCGRSGRCNRTNGARWRAHRLIPK